MEGNEEAYKIDPKRKYEGIDAISIRMKGRAYNTLVHYRKSMNFPMFKSIGIWVAIEEDIAKWEEFQDNGVFFEEEDRPSLKKSTVRKKSTRKTSKSIDSK